MIGMMIKMQEMMSVSASPWLVTRDFASHVSASHAVNVSQDFASPVLASRVLASQDFVSHASASRASASRASASRDFVSRVSASLADK